MTNQISKDGPSKMQLIVTVATVLLVLAALGGIGWLVWWAIG